MSRIYWDTMLFIYLIEEHPTYVERLEQILARIETRGDQLCSSALAPGEVLVAAKERNDQRLAEAIRTVICPPHVELLPFDGRGKLRGDSGTAWSEARRRHSPRLRGSGWRGSVPDQRCRIGPTRRAGHQVHRGT